MNESFSGIPFPDFIIRIRCVPWDSRETRDNLLGNIEVISFRICRQHNQSCPSTRTRVPHLITASRRRFHTLITRFRRVTSPTTVTFYGSNFRPTFCGKSKMWLIKMGRYLGAIILGVSHPLEHGSNRADRQDRHALSLASRSAGAGVGAGFSHKRAVSTFISTSSQREGCSQIMYVHSLLSDTTHIKIASETSSYHFKLRHLWIVHAMSIL